MARTKRSQHTFGGVVRENQADRDALAAYEKAADAAHAAERRRDKRGRFTRRGLVARLLGR